MALAALKPENLRGARCKALLRLWEKFQHYKDEADNLNLIRSECIRRERANKWTESELCVPSLHLPRK
jgi:hypothetical protein